jgi:hypothetical protein
MITENDIALKRFTGCLLYGIFNIEPKSPFTCEFVGEIFFNALDISFRQILFNINC